jgi:hypothetical protein
VSAFEVSDLARDLEAVERRVLGAVRFVDVTTGLPVADPVAVAAPGTTLWRNRRGDYVIARAPGLAAHERAFAAAPDAPALGSVAVVLTVRDPRGRYLPRRRTIALPRDPDPDHADQPGSLFRPEPVALFPAPGAPTAPAWATVRVRVTRAGSERGVRGALLLARFARRDGTPEVARGMTDARGEGLVAVPGIPVTTFGGGTGPVLGTEIEATLEVFVDPAVDAPGDPGPAPAPAPDPDDLEARRADLATASAPVGLASGRAVTVALAVALP